MNSIKYVNFKSFLTLAGTFITSYAFAQTKEATELYSNKNWIIFLSIIVLLLSYNLYKRLRYIRKMQELLQQTNETIAAQKGKAEKALSSLKSTQLQLIQTEKMASLGELTAGIAHEIQNPLNFVNNFSEVSKELISELKIESSKVESERNRGLENEILNDISENLEKIYFHGKRASDIVKGMLEHSKRPTGQKTPTDINVLCDEFLRLAYYGIKAKERSFNCTIERFLDPNLPKIDVIPQDLGRVILNLINNGIWAATERSKKEEIGFEPIVSITTKHIANNQMLISVQDNGSGIPDRIKDKIFQPFFTTKPAGQGVGLGLSLSYEIVKAHGGELKVESKEDKGSQFHFILPYLSEEKKAEDVMSNYVEKNAAAEIKGINILLVEDNAFNIVVSTEELEEAIEDVHIDVAENGLIAIEKIKSSTYDIILMDIQMPVMSGFEATKNIRNMKSEKSKTPIIAMTAYVHQEEIDLCYEAGMNDFIGKPFDTDELLYKIFNLLNKIS
jgi:signal transduction histidine kinase/CheY-like chemotaxis protein